MRKPTYSEIYMYKNLVWLGVAAFIFCPIFNNVFLKVLLGYVDANIAYRSLTLPLLIVQAVFSFAPLYIGFGVLAVAVINFGSNAKAVVRIAFISKLTELLSMYFGELIASKSILSVVEPLITVIINTVALLAVFVVVFVYAKKKNTCMNVDKYVFSRSMLKHPYTRGMALMCAIYVLLNVTTEVISNVSYITDPKNYYNIPNDVGGILLQFGLPYLLIISLALLGFIIMVGIGLVAERFKKSGKRKFIELNKKAAE